MSKSLLVLRPLAGAWGAGEILPPCAQLLWCELYVMKDSHTKKKKVARTAETQRVCRGRVERCELTEGPRCEWM